MTTKKTAKKAEEKKPKTFDEKMSVLKKMHARSAPEALEQLKSWEEQMQRLQIKLDWYQHPATKELRELARTQIQAANDVLANKEDLTEEDRKAIIKMKNAHMVYLAVLSEDPEKEIQTIENFVENEL